MKIQITKYGYRNWAVWIGDDLLAVTVYRKGAQAIADFAERFTKYHHPQTEDTEAPSSRRTHRSKRKAGVSHSR